jgi:hypothetical protein
VVYVELAHLLRSISAVDVASALAAPPVICLQRTSAGQWWWVAAELPTQSTFTWLDAGAGGGGGGGRLTQALSRLILS